MTDSSHVRQEPVGAQFVLHPHRSLSQRGFLILMAVLSGVSFVAGVAFCMIGAWPVMGFFGLDVALVYWAFKANYRSGRSYETVDVTPSTVTVTRVSAAGVRQAESVNSYWARVRLVDDQPDGRTALQIIAERRELCIGAFLTDDERRDLAEALRSALSAARAPQF